MEAFLPSGSNHSSVDPVTAAQPDAAASSYPSLRWWIVGMLFLASTINYMDRSTLAVVAPRLRTDFHLDNTQYASITEFFLVSYAIMYTLSGRIIDWIGARVGMALTITWWSIAAALHSFARGLFSLRLFQVLLGIGEPGMFPATVRTVRECFPPSERALAVGIFNSGTSIGGVLAPPVVVYLMVVSSWRMAFVVVGALGLIWMVGWLFMTRFLQRRHPGIMLSDGEREARGIKRSKVKVRWAELLRHRQVWGILLGRVFADPAWFFYLFWLPTYLYSVRHFSLTAIGAYGALIPAFTGDLGNIAGGWFSGFLNKNGLPVIRARKMAMLATVAMMPIIFFGTRSVSDAVVVGAISLATMMHQSWSANITTMPADVCPESVVGSVAGMAGTAGAGSGAVFSAFVGWAADHHHYPLVFLAATAIYPIGWLLVNWLVRKPWDESQAAA